VLIALQHVQAILIFHHGSSSFSHIPARAWRLIEIVAEDAFLALGLLLHYYWVHVLVFLACVKICFNMPCTFCGWISILVYIYIHGFLTINDKKKHFVRDFVYVCVCLFSLEHGKKLN
jgi:hypothetical protein